MNEWMNEFNFENKPKITSTEKYKKFVPEDSLWKSTVTYSQRGPRVELKKKTDNKIKRKNRKNDRIPES